MVDEKRSSEIFDVKMEIFPKKGHSKIWSAKFCFRAPKLGAKSPLMCILIKNIRGNQNIVWEGVARTYDIIGTSQLLGACARIAPSNLRLCRQ